MIMINFVGIMILCLLIIEFEISNASSSIGRLTTEMKEWTTFTTITSREKKGRALHKQQYGMRYLRRLNDNSKMLEREIWANLDEHQMCIIIESDECKRVLSKKVYDLTNAKLAHPRNLGLPKPLNFDEMLAVILYTDPDGNEFYKKLRNAEISGDWWTWQIWSSSLSEAIFKLMMDPNAKKPQFLYHGLHAVNFEAPDTKEGDRYRLDTFTSFTDRLSVAKRFCNGKGVIIRYQFDGDTTDKVQNGFADISWISVYDEGEWLLNHGYSLSAMSVIVDDKEPIIWVDMVVSPKNAEDDDWINHNDGPYNPGNSDMGSEMSQDSGHYRGIGEDDDETCCCCFTLSCILRCMQKCGCD